MRFPAAFIGVLERRWLLLVAFIADLLPHRSMGRGWAREARISHRSNPHPLFFQLTLLALFHGAVWKNVRTLLWNASLSALTISFGCIRRRGLQPTRAPGPAWCRRPAVVPGMPDPKSNSPAISRVVHSPLPHQKKRHVIRLTRVDPPSAIFNA